MRSCSAYISKHEIRSGKRSLAVDIRISDQKILLRPQKMAKIIIIKGGETRQGSLGENECPRHLKVKEGENRTSFIEPFNCKCTFEEGRWKAVYGVREGEEAENRSSDYTKLLLRVMDFFFTDKVAFKHNVPIALLLSLQGPLSVIFISSQNIV